MNLRYLVGGMLIVGVLIAVLVVGGLGTAVYVGEEPVIGSDPPPDDDIEELPTGTTDGNSTAGTQPFAFTIAEIESCGRTCRDVTATVENQQTEPASSVVVETEMFAGENTTVSDRLVWEETQDVGRLPAGESHTSTERVDLSLGDAFDIRQQDGWITIRTTIESDEETVTITKTRNVA